VIGLDPIRAADTLGMRTLAAWLLVSAVGGSACAGSAPVRLPSERARILEVREGLASYYGEGFHGRLTASGRPFDMHAMVAAHPSYPFGTVIRVTNLRNGRSATVRIFDRGPARGPRRDGVVIDLSRGAATALDFVRQGRTRVRLEVLEWGGQ
jgi:rare lipoprotein A